MIVYNMRYRGPLEYDKFVLNVFQFHNDVHNLIAKEFDNGSGDLVMDQKSINDMFKTTTGYQGAVPGSSENLYLNMLELKEC